LVLAAVTAAGTLAFGDAAPHCVSPGAVDRVLAIQGACPTFSWQAVQHTAFYELVVYELPPGADHDADLELTRASEVVYARVVGGASAWTPSLEQCLAPGAAHAWFVRAVFDPDTETAGEWSQPLLFAVSAMPSAGEVHEAIAVLQRYAESSNGRSGSPEPDALRTAGRVVWASKVAPRDVPSAVTAIRGEHPDPAGETYGSVGVSASPGGAGVGAANLAGGADLVLDGSIDGAADAVLYEHGLDRPSAAPQSFAFSNSGGGSMTLAVDGTIVGDGSGLTGVTAADAQLLDGRAGTFYRDASSINDGMLSVDRFSAWADLQSDGHLGNAAGDIAQNNGVLQDRLDADRLDGAEGAFYRDAGSLDTGVLDVERFSAWADLQSEGRLDDSAGDIAQNNGVLQPGLNADLLDGVDSSSFAAAAHDHAGAEWTNFSGNGLKVTSWADDGEGLRGEARSMTGVATGVVGLAPNGSSGRGVYGSGGGVGVHGYGENGEGSVGVLAQAYSRSIALAAYSSVGTIIEGHSGEPGDSELRFKVSGVGNVYADGTYSSPAGDLAEMLPAAEGLVPGDVLVIAPDGRLARSSLAGDPAVAGVYSTRPAFLGGGDTLGAPGHVPLAIAGIVPVRASAEGGVIRPGELLTTSSTPGHAMRAGPAAGQGTVVGKALEGLEGGEGIIQMLVMLQ
jgi:hypothetical protein